MRVFALFLLSCVAFGQTPAAAPPAPQKIRTLLLTGSNTPGHDWPGVSPLLKKALEDSGKFEVRINEEPRGTGPETLAPYDLVVLNYYDLRKPELQLDDRTKKALVDYVKSGKGLVVFHFSTAAFDGWTEYEQIAAGNWRPNNGHHSPPHDFTVEIVDVNHPITRGLAKTMPQPNDELYANLKWQPDGTYKVLAVAWDDHKLYKNPKQPTPGDGRNQPMLWVTEPGKGRVFVTALGHDKAAVQTPTFVTTFVRGAEWAATGDVKASK